MCGGGGSGYVMYRTINFECVACEHGHFIMLNVLCTLLSMLGCQV